MKLKDFDFRIWDKGEETLTYASKDWKLGINFCNPQQDKWEVESELHAYYDGEPMCPSDCEIELWSGLYDIKGTKLYEGDIVCFKNRGKYNDDRDEVLAKHIKEKCLKKTFLAQIFFKNVGGGYCIEREVKRGKKYLGKRYFSLFDMLHYFDFKLEVVGNIHYKGESE
ncbi:hypothetical protein T36_0547 [Helicobacter cinaedi]|uniref:hypothetical protein n=1 Tax=Helicobacter cinaedi TaxID=213 RepID=UPI001F44EC63|nr:hypothetical protein [Helicobacter cinaedi]BDB64100.1 hypothetical protein T36_0547 [Helicobacter cinaedi]